MSGFLTARFLLHLRRWVAESNGDEDSLDQPNIVLDFLDSAQAATQQSVVNEFGEDPVLRERNRERESIQVER
ncbi:hypothetical protein CPB84DRAFT_1765149 [Gymnopilus junonius]|uniref:Uncharacterized protein n=1 Tax=Gymnopilus junonius TaxID=109634 RepID=A0A9P5TRK7_GYMJU|nr:hypothetical protein CPB84DRAFT_1765149 [Gymnopilus junonius]